MSRSSLSAMLRGLVAVAAGTLMPGIACAQDAWPSARISAIVGFAAGGFADTVGRVIAKEMADRLKQPVVVQNMPGAGGNTAGRHVSVSAADGYTILITTTALAINHTLYKNKGFATDALTPIAIPVTAPESMSANAKGDLKSFRDLERVAGEGRLFVGSAGIGSGSHISAEYFFKMRAKLKITHIPFQGGSNALHALLTGDINVLATTAGAATSPAIMRGEIIGIGIASRERLATIPMVPTFAELGFAGFEASSWVGFFAPAATPVAVLDLLNREINAALASPDAKARFDTIGLTGQKRSRTETEAYFTEDVKRWAEMVKATGLSM